MFMILIIFSLKLNGELMLLRGESLLDVLCYFEYICDYCLYFI